MYDLCIYLLAFPVGSKVNVWGEGEESHDIWITEYVYLITAVLH